MARKSATKEASVTADFSGEKDVVRKHMPLEHLSIDLGREDLNTMAKRINEIIDHLNA